MWFFFFFKLFSCFCTTLSALIYSFPSGNTFALRIRCSVYLVPAAYCFHGVLFDLPINRKITDTLGIKSRRNEVQGADKFWWILHWPNFCFVMLRSSVVKINKKNKKTYKEHVFHRTSDASLKALNYRSEGYQQFLLLNVGFVIRKMSVFSGRYSNLAWINFYCSELFWPTNF